MWQLGHGLQILPATWKIIPVGFSGFFSIVGFHPLTIGLWGPLPNGHEHGV